MRSVDVGRAVPRFGSRTVPTSAIWIALAVVIALLGGFLPLYWVYLLSTVAISAMIARGIGVVTNQVGIITLCQMSFAAIGGWVVSWIALQWPEAPFPLLVVIGGVATAPIGLLLGLATARIRGVELAVVTLGFAAAFDLVLRQGSFPGVGKGISVVPAAPFDDPRWFFALSWGLLIVLQLVIWALGRTSHGLSWSAVRGSERAAAALGIRAWWSKATAFAAGALFAGIAGGMLAGQYGLLTTSVFTPLTSMVHLATAVLCGASIFSGALLAGLFGVFVPEALRRIGLPLDVGNALLALGAFDVLRRGNGGIAEQMRDRLQDRAFRDERTSCDTSAGVGSGAQALPSLPSLPSLQPFPPLPAERAHGGRVCTSGATPQVHVDPPGAHSREKGVGEVEGTAAGTAAEITAAGDPSPRPRLEIRGLTVEFGGNRALDAVDLDLRAGEVHALIGPNGAGKSTLVDAVTGFLPEAAGEVRFEGGVLEGVPAHARARRGIRRTFQQSRAVTTLTVEQYLRAAAPRSTEAQREAAREFLGLPAPRVPVRLLDVGSRRILEIAAALAASPSVLLLDESAAGLGEAEREFLAERLHLVPRAYDCAVLLIEHDMEFVRAASDCVTVLEEGRVIAAGPVADTLESARVIAAYLGKETAR
ncbi:MAG: ATP-binding cassette domain-containing protein [Leucobacter sp.]